MKIVVIGLGYVGLPLAVQLALHFDVWGFDTNEARVEELKRSYDRTQEIASDVLRTSKLAYCSNRAECPASDIYIVTVPTPIDAKNDPDLRPLIKATEALGEMIDPVRAPIIVYESTVYPGVTEEVCGPILENYGLIRGRDFFLGYSPERINPGDKENTVDRIVKVVAGENSKITDILASVYGKVTSAGVYKAANIKTAEAAKVIENAQRDINIAFMNEITRIFSEMDISVWDVLEAAKTKWNFLPFQPGLVGGHCIGVDPYYLSYRANQLGCDAQVILAGRKTNDSMSRWIALQIDKKIGRPGSMLVMGLTFKENVPDLRNSKAIDLIRTLEELGHHITVHDPIASKSEAFVECGLSLVEDPFDAEYDVVVLAVAHDQYRGLSADMLEKMIAADGFIADIKRAWANLERQIGPGRYWTI